MYLKRSSVIAFENGKPVFLLEEAERTTRVNKNYTTINHATLTCGDLPEPDERLKYPPAGWKPST